MAQITPNMTIAEILQMLGIDIDITDVDAVQGAMAAIQDLIIARGDESLLGLIKNQLPPGIMQPPTQSSTDDPRLNKPTGKGNKKQQNDDNDDNSNGAGEDDDDDDEYTPTRKNQNTNPKPLDPEEDPEIQRRSKIKRTAEVVQSVIDKINGSNDYNTPAAKADKKDLEELLKQLTDNPDMTLEELSDIEDQALDIAGRYTKIFRQDEPSRQARIKKIQDDAENPETLKAIDAEDTANRRQAYQQRPKSEVHTDGAKTFRSFDSFLQDLYRAIKAQIVRGEKPQDTWSKLPRRAQQGVLKRGEMAQEYNREVPTIDFFLDASASWSTDEQRYADDAISTIKQFEAQGKLHINLYYFGNNVTKDRALVWGSGTGAWSHILETIEKDGSQNVVIITDSDMERQGTHSRNMTVPGYVWYLWRDRGGGAENAPRLPNELKGEIETSEYAFNIQED